MTTQPPRPEVKKAVLDLLSSHQQDARLDEIELDQKIARQFKKILEVAKQAPWWSGQIANLQSEINAASSMRELLSIFPVLARTDIQSDPSKFWTRPSLDQTVGYSPRTTSGSSGKPVTIYRHENTHGIQHWASELLDVVWQKRDLTKNTALIKVAPENDQMDSLGEPFTYLGPTGKAFRRSLSNNTIPELLDFLSTENVKNFLANPKVLKFLIDEQFRSPRPNARFEQIMTWADQLDPGLRVQAMDVFGAKISDRYSSSEFGFLAIQCPESEHLHALQFNNYIEILNDKGQACERGELGRVVVTSLQNLAMPLIRYELGDIASFAEPCMHGINLPVFEPKISRSREVILLEDGSLEIPYFDDTALAKHPDIIDSQCYRFSDAMVVIFSARSVIDSEVLELTKQKLQEVFRSTSDFRVLQVESLDFLGLWKRKLILDIPQKIPAEINQKLFEDLS